MSTILLSIQEPELKTIIQDAVKNVLVGVVPTPQPKDLAPELFTRAKTAEYLGYHCQPSTTGQRTVL